MGSEHEIAHYKTAVVDTVAPPSFGKYHDDDGCTIEGVACSAKYSGIHPADAVADLAVGHHQHFRMLESHSVGGIFSAFHDLCNLFL